MTDKKFYFKINNIFFSKIIISRNNYRKKIVLKPTQVG
jgi:hypothetical protein